MNPRTSAGSLGALALALSIGVGAAALAAPAGGLKGDPALQKRITLAPGRVRLEQILADLSRQTSLSITAEEAILEDPVICSVRNRRAVDVLEVLALVMRYRVQNAGDGYRLSLDPALAEMVARYRKLRRSLTEVREAENEAHFGAWARALSGPSEGDRRGDVGLMDARSRAPELGEFFKQLNDEQLGAMAFGLTIPHGSIPATGTGGMDKRIVGARPLSSLPAGLAGMLASKGIAPSPSARIGVALTGIGAALSIQDESGLRWFPPVGARINEYEDLRHTQRARDQASLKPIRAYEERGPDWIDPRLKELKLPPNLVPHDPRRVALDGKRATQPGDEQWMEWSRKCDVTLIADGFCSSTFVRAAPVPPGRLTPSQWARVLADRFHRKYRLYNGMLLVRSRQGVSDRAQEIPRSVIDAANKSIDRYGRLELLSLARLARSLDDDQLARLWSVPELRVVGLDQILLQHHRLILRLIASSVSDETPYDDAEWQGPLKLESGWSRKAFGYLKETVPPAPPDSGAAAVSGANRRSEPSLSLKVNGASAELLLSDGRGWRGRYPLPLAPRKPAQPVSPNQSLPLRDSHNLRQPG